jgi:hypothetical protein
MGGYLSFKSSGLLFPRLTEQHPFTRLPHAMRLRVFDEAHTENLQILKLAARSRRTETRILQQIKAGHSPQCIQCRAWEFREPVPDMLRNRTRERRLRLGK